MQFGKKAGVISSTSTTSATGEWPKSLRDGETRVRFLLEIADWIEYWEHFDDSAKFFPCTGDKNTCPGCTSDSEKTRKASKRYLAPVLDPRTGKVYALKIPLDLANRLSLRNDRNNGTITSRDYTLIRSGKGLDTEYDVEQEERVAIDLSVYQDVIDLQDMLGSQFAAAWPEFDPDNPVKRNGPARRRRSRDDEDEAPAPRRRRSPTEESMTRPPATAPDGGSTEDPPSEAPARPAAPAPEPEPTAQLAADGDDEMIDISEADLRGMTRNELITLARKAGAPVRLTMGRDEVIDILLENFSV